MAHSQFSLFGTLRDALRGSQALGCISFTYHLTVAIETPHYRRPRRLFSNAWPNQSEPVSIAMRQHIESIHDIVVEQGHPTTYRTIMQCERLLNAPIARQIDARVAASGLTDELIIPVYGPFGTEGCVCFGLPKMVESLSKPEISHLEGLAIRSHSRFVNGFRERIQRLNFSEEQLLFIKLSALGLKQAEIAEQTYLNLAEITSLNRLVRAKIGFGGRLSFVLTSLVLKLLTVEADKTLRVLPTSARVLRTGT